MIDPAQIPDEVVEAAARAIADTDCPASLFLTCESHHGGCMCRDRARAAIAAALNAWSNAKTLRDDGRRQTYIVPALILPLTQQYSDE